MSGIDCSSKTPAYYLGQSHGFNTVHGRMPSVTTGAHMVNHDLLYLGVSGDGDSASIGIGQLIHAIRRNLNMVYIVENNGVYGLTKGNIPLPRQGIEEEEGPGEHRPTDRPLRACDQPRMHLRRTVLLWIEEAVDCSVEGRHEPRGIRAHRRHQPLCDLQQQRGNPTAPIRT